MHHCDFARLPPRVFLLVVHLADMYARHVKGKWDASKDPVRAEMGVHYWAVDASKARTELGWTPRNPEQTLRDTIEDIREQQARERVRAKM